MSSQAEWIRKYVLDKLGGECNCWYEMEDSFYERGKFKSDEFEYFISYYFTIKTCKIPKGDLCSKFKKYPDKDIEKLVSEICCFAKFYTKIAFEREKDKKLNKVIKYINILDDYFKIESVYPLLLQIYIDYSKGKISKDERLKIFEIIESYIIRCAICYARNSFNTIFKKILNQIKKSDKSQYFENLKDYFKNPRKYFENLENSEFPRDDDFEEEFQSKDLYNTYYVDYILERLENCNREKKINMKKYSIEHIMPQKLTKEWKKELGDKKKYHKEYLHTIGNLTLIKNNSRLSNKSFDEKRNMKGGYANSHVKLNHYIAEQEKWGIEDIKKRGKKLAKQAVKKWKYPCSE